MSDRKAVSAALSLRLRLLLIIAGALLIPAGLAGLDAVQGRTRTAEATAAEALAGAQAAAARRGAALAALEGGAITLARFADAAGDAAACASIRDATPRPVSPTMLLVGPAGTIVCASWPDAVGSKADPAMFQRGPGGPGWLEPTIALDVTLGGRRRIAISHPLRDGGAAVVLVDASLPVPTDSKALASALLGPEGTVLDVQGGALLAPGGDATADPLLAGLLRGPPGEGATAARGGLRWSFVPVPGVPGMHLAVATADDQGREADLRLIRRLALIAAIWLASALAGWVAAGLWVLPWLRAPGRRRPDNRVPVEVAAITEATERHAAELAAAQSATSAAAAAAATAEARAERVERGAVEARATMGRGVRTPMSSILGFTDLLLATDLTAQQRRHALHVRDSARDLLAVVNEAIDRRPEGGALEVCAEAFAPASLIDGCAALVRTRAAAKGLTLRTIVAPGTPAHVLGDPIRLRQALVNLADNAVRATPWGGVSIAVTPATLKDGRPALRFTVADAGPGLPEGVLAGGPGAPGPEPAGLGLAISSELAHRMGGRLGIAARAGGGSDVWIEIPLATVSDALGADAPACVAPRAQHRILLAEDNPMNEELIRAILESAGHTVTSVGDGRSAVEAIRTIGFDLALLDVRMPVMNGLDATAAIRRLDGPAARVPIIILTADALPEDIARALAAGADAHHAKPIVHRELLDAVERLAHKGGRPEADATPTDLGLDLPEEMRRPAPDFDPAELESLRARMTPERFRGMLTRASNAFPDRLRRLRADADLQLLAEIAHETAGSAGTYGLAETARLSRLLQRACDGRLEADREDLLRRLAASAARGLDALAAYAGDLPQG